MWRNSFRIGLGGLLLFAGAAHAERDFSGQTASGAYYSIRLPDAWKSGDALVLFQHGLSFDPPAPNPSLGPIADLQVAEGYAVAASSYSQRAWALFNAPDDNAQLLAAFKTQVGAPGAIIPYGGSLGGLIALKLAEDPRFAPVPGVYSACPPAAGSRVWDFGIDARLAYDVVCKDVNSAGQLPTGKQPIPWAYNLSDIPDNLSDLEDEAQLIQTLLPVNVCTGINLPPLLQNDAMVRRLAELKTFSNVTTDKFFLTDMGYATYALSDLVRAADKLNGLSPFTTVGVVYPDPAINSGIARITADPFAQLYFRWASDFRGRVDPATKVISIQTSEDELVIPANQYVLRQTLPATQLTSALVNESTPTHCGFNLAEGVAGWEALRAWIAGSPQPQVADLQNDCQAAITAGAAGPCRFDASIVPPSFDSKVAARPASSAAPVDARYSGGWYDPARSGEGIELEILPNNKAGLYFFTYPPAGVAGTQAWVYGIGDIVGNGIEFADVLRPLRDAQGHVTQQHWGRIALTFSDCNSAGMRWDGPDNWGSMEVPLQRLAALNGLDCASNASTAAQSSGAWYDPATSGDGFLIDQLDAQTLSVLYFGLNQDGTQTWYQGLAAAAAGGNYAGPLLWPQGTQFGAAFDASKIGKSTRYLVQGLTLACATGSATLSPASGQGPSLLFALHRLTVPLGVAACSP
ncbi:MAG: hypothetical protein ACREPT_01450 [Rudaea sp.]